MIVDDLELKFEVADTLSTILDLALDGIPNYNFDSLHYYCEPTERTVALTVFSN